MGSETYFFFWFHICIFSEIGKHPSHLLHSGVEVIMFPKYIYSMCIWSHSKTHFFLQWTSESWTVKKAEHRRIDAFELWCWRRLLRVPWTARRSNQSILKEISPGIFGRNDVEAETPVLWPPHSKSWLTGKDSDAWRDWGQEEKGTTEDEMAGWHHWLDGRELSELRELVMDREAWRAVIHGVAKSWTRLSDWSDLWFTNIICTFFCTYVTFQ